MVSCLEEEEAETCFVFVFSGFFLSFVFLAAVFQFLVVGCLRTDAINRFVCLPDAFFGYDAAFVHVFGMCECVCTSKYLRDVRGVSHSPRTL